MSEEGAASREAGPCRGGSSEAGGARLSLVGVGVGLFMALEATAPEIPILAEPLACE